MMRWWWNTFSSTIVAKALNWRFKSQVCLQAWRLLKRCDCRSSQSQYEFAGLLPVEMRRKYDGEWIHWTLLFNKRSPTGGYVIYQEREKICVSQTKVKYQHHIYIYFFSSHLRTFNCLPAISTFDCLSVWVLGVYTQSNVALLMKMMVHHVFNNFQYLISYGWPFVRCVIG